MLKKTIKFLNLEGTEIERDYYFHLGDAELAEMAFSADSMEARLDRIMAAKDGEAIMNEFRAIIRKSIGMRSDDGISFIKNDDIADRFMGSNAFDVLFFELLTDAKKSAAFIEGLVPANMQERIAKHLKGSGLELPKKDEDKPAWERENRPPTLDEFKSMTPEQQQKAFAARMGN